MHSIQGTQRGERMPRYYCHSCASSMGELRVCSSGPFNSTYQLEKYIKHTVPDSSYSY